tara:strand:+ start:968 stop:1342 length:375 start_codon:yes stop_codon:yes gene_type:complete
MKKLFVLLLLTAFVFSCSSDDDDNENEVVYSIELNNTTSRITFQTIRLPGHDFYLTSQQETRVLHNGLTDGLNNVRVVLSGVCSVQNREVNEEIFVNFLKDTPTVVLSCGTVTVCAPTMQISYK